MSPDRSLDPNRTAAHLPAEQRQSDTVDVTGEQTDPTAPTAPTAPVDWPQLPGYEVAAVIASGGMGRVYAGRDLSLEREVAIKTLLPTADADRFVTESKITARLPHPGIPPVHALGTLADGSPYLVMKLIRGRTLAALLSERANQQQDLPRFVQVFEQIAQAVGFAHSRGVIHRDLKPLNVMVGEFGEVQVMDWGLAKDATSRERESPEAIPTNDVHYTRAGTVMGTPGYMAPEQARGEVVDARADVFALGSVLAAVLTGKPAFVGTTVQETISKAAAADLADVISRLEACGADAELVALARRCLSATPEARPTDARQMASEVAAYRAGVEARLRQSETDRARAETRADEHAKRRRVVQWAGSLVAVVLLTGLVVSLWQMNRAVAAEGLAKGNEKTALDERDAKDTALKAETKARAAERVALDRAKTALGSLTDDMVESQMTRSAKLTEENREFLRTILRQYDALAAVTGDDAESRSLRSEGLFRVGLMRSRLGDLKEAEAAYRDALAIRRQLAADFADNPNYRSDLAKCHSALGSLLRLMGRLKEAETALFDSLILYEQLAAEFPVRADIRRELAVTHTGLGVLQYETGRTNEAEAAYLKVVAIRQQLADDFPAKPEFRFDLAASHNNLGVLMAITSRPEKAVAAYRDALAISKRLVDDFPTRSQYRRDLAANHINLGIQLNRIGLIEKSEAAYRDALAITRQLAAEFPASPLYREDLATNHHNLGILLQKAGRMNDAEVACREALAVYQQLATAFPNRPDFQAGLSGSLSFLGVLQQTTGQLKGAEAAYRDSLVIKRKLTRDFPAVTEYQIGLGGTCCNLGNLLWNTRKSEDCLVLYAEAIATLQKVLDGNPKHPTVREFLFNSHHSRAQAHHELGKYADAVKDWDRVVDLSPPVRQRFFRGDRASSQVWAGQVTEAIAEMNELTKLPGWNANALYHLARIYAAAAGKDPSKKVEYAGKAIELLQLAMRDGFKDTVLMRRDAYLDPLRDRDDFKQIVARLEEKTPNSPTSTATPESAPPPRAVK